MSQQDLEQSATQNKLSTMAQLYIKIEPEIHNDDTPHAHNVQQDTFLTCSKEMKYESMLHDEIFIKDDPDSDNKCSELIDDKQVMCASTSQSSDGVAMHIKEEPATDVGYDARASQPITQLDATHLHLIGPCAGYVRLANTMLPANPAAQQECLHCCNPMYRQTASGPSPLPVPMKDEVEDKAYLRILSFRSVHKQQVVPSNSDCTRKVNVKKRAKCNSSGKTYQCDVCHKCFSWKCDLQRHIRSHTGEKPFKCNICDKSYSQASNLKTHIRTHMEKKPCDICNKIVSDKVNLIYRCVHTGERQYKCDMCDKSFYKLSNLNRHIRVHTGDKPYKCDICNKSFSDQSHLKMHGRTHTGEKPHKCNMCDKSFSQLSNLRSHILKHTGEKSYKCIICYKSFSTLGHLKTHSSTHTGEKTHKCNICDKLFSQSGNLKSHLSSHTGEKLHTCAMCDKSFSCVSNLYSHIRTHTGEKPHKCDICYKTFSQPGHLKRHIRIHTGEKPYKCSICDKSFCQMGNLKSHARAHTGEKPYECSMCDRGFSHLANLQIHIRTHTGEKPYRCNICYRSFSQLVHLKRHACKPVVKGENQEQERHSKK